MKKKILSLCLVVAMAATAIVGASMAYLTDTDSDVNVMTLGNVDIELVEKQRDGNGGLEDFEQAKILYPIVGSAQEGEDGLKLPTAANYVDKIVTVDNTGKSDAWVRVIIAYPSALDATNASDMILHWNQDANFVMGEGEGYTDSRYTSKVNELSDKAVEIDGVDYNLYVFTYSQPIKADTMAMRPVLTGMYLDSRVDYDADTGKYTMNGEEIDYDFSNGVALPVYVQAVQTAGFATADDAFAAAFTNEATVAWIQGTSIPTVVSTAEELTAALTAGEDVVLVEDVTVDANTAITVAPGKDVTLNLNGHEITATANKTGNQELFLVKGNMTVENGTLTLTAENNQGWNAMATLFDVTAGGVLNMNGVTANVSGTDMNFVVHLNNWGTATLNVEDCDFTTTYCAVRVFNSGYDMNNVTITNTDFHTGDTNGNGRAFWVHNYTSEGKDDSTLNLDIYNNGNTSDHEKPVRFGFSESTYYDLNGNQIPNS